MGDVRLDLTQPAARPRRTRRLTALLVVVGVAIAAALGVALDPFGDDDRPALSSVAGKTFWSSGDSTSYYMSIALTRRLREGGGIAVQAEPAYVNSSGLASRDFFDWPAELRNVGAEDVDVVFFMIGANDARDGLDLDVYRAEVAEIMDGLQAEGRLVIWVGQPNMADAGRALKVLDVNDVFRSEANERPWVRYVDTWEATSDESGAYTQFVEIDGETIKIREDDGLHFTADGGELLAETVIRAVFAE